MEDGRRSHAARRALELLAAAGLAATTLVWGLPRVAQADWHQIGQVLGTVGPGMLAALAVLWLVGLWLHTIALSAAMPGLSHPRAFFLNITGSCVSNLLPLGGTAGTLVNWWSARTWGFSTPAFVRWALVTNIWDVLTRLLVPGVALLWLALVGVGDVEALPDTEALAGAAAGAAGVLTVLVVVTIVLLRGDRGAVVVGRLADRVLATLWRERGTPDGRAPTSPAGVERAIAVRRSMVALITTAWPGLTVGKLLYAAAQAALLWACLEAVGTAPAATVVFAAFAVERVLSLAVITPGATGIVEVGMTGFLARMGANPVDAAAGVLLYRIFVIGMEVPVGGLLLGVWSAARLRHHRGPVQPAGSVPVPGFGMPQARE